MPIIVALKRAFDNDETVNDNLEKEVVFHKITAI